MNEPNEISHRLREIAATLDALLRVRYPADADHPNRNAMIISLLSNEINRYRATPLKATSLEEIFAVSALASRDVTLIRNRCLFYGCDSLIGFLVNKRIRYDVIAREEAVLYVQDRLQRDDFRRIHSFQVERGANFVTYIWQVINNLLLDFLRAHGKHRSQPAESEDASNGDSESCAAYQPAVDSLVEGEKLRELLVEAMSSERVDDVHPLRERLRRHLALSSKERIFLKALFQYDMSLAEICELPGFAMSTGEAYRFYYRVMDQLRNAFKSAGVLDAMRDLVSEAAPRITVTLAGERAVVAATRIPYLQQLDRSLTGCHADWKGAVIPGTIHESFNKVSKRLAAYFTPIDSTTAVSDTVLATTHRDWRSTGQFAIAGIAKPFRISTRILGELRKRFEPEKTA